ncbi:hypothetical protein GEMRC1_008755 [Eukaryota sp. GEM-RC1]
MESIPIQVARIEAGVFLPLRDGLESLQVNGVTAQQIAEQLRFGVFELLFAAYSHLPVSVIVCAGGQSSGKSTFLNHMFNHFFDVSGGRTTQGVWFGVRVIAGRMWIAIDLEGLDSFERTAQGQSYQAIFGAALAQYFVLRTTHHFDRLTQNCLNSWADASLGLAEGDELFKGTLLMTPRDVSDDAIEEVIESFSTDFESFWTSSLRFKNGEHRHVLSIFPTTEFIPWPSYGSFSKYSEAIGFLLDKVNEEKPRFQNAPEFHQIATLLLAKLYVQDFSPLSQSIMRQQVDDVESSLHDVIAAGLIGPSQLNSDVVSTPSEVLDDWLDEAEPDNDYPNYDSLTIPLPINQNQRNRLTAPGGLTVNSSDCIELSNLPDSGMILGVPNSLQSSDVDYRHLILQRLIELFEARVLIQNHRADQMLFDSFLAALLIRRKEAITQWFNAKSSGYYTESVFTRLSNEVQMSLDILTITFRLCRGRCTQQIHAQSMSCNLECSLLVNHEGSCQCLGYHACTGDCILCNPHETHPCDQPCSHEGCDAPCREFLNVPHVRHHCGKKCPLCSRYDAISEHLHLPDSDQHLCGHWHNCPNECQKSGNCEVLTRLKHEDDVYITSTGDQIKFTQFSEQVATKKQCGAVISETFTSHEGPCYCDAAIHYCDFRCESCDYFCTKPIGHQGPHSGTHGNMRNRKLVSSAQKVKVGSIGTFGRGDSGIALTCTHSCREFGRGHIHLVPVDHPKIVNVPESAKRIQEKEKIW